MKHVLFGGKSLLLDDATADALLEYAGLLPSVNEGDTVTVKAISPDGNEVSVTVLLNASIEMIAETTTSSMQPPENDVVEIYLRDRIQALRNPPSALTESRTASTGGRGLDEFDGL